MNQPLLEVSDLHVSYGAIAAVRGVSLDVHEGEIVTLIGNNGAGKSTLLRIMAGVDQDYIGEIAQSKGYTVGLLAQEPKLDENKTVIEVIREAVQPIVDMLARFEEVNAKFAEPDADFDALVEEQGKLQDALDKVDAWNLDSHLEVAMDALRCPDGDAQVETLSGGERRRVALCRLLLDAAANLHQEVLGHRGCLQAEPQRVAQSNSSTIACGDAVTPSA